MAKRSIEVEILYRVVAPHYVAGFIVRDGVVRESAPILGWSVGRPIDRVLAYFRRKGITAIELSLEPKPDSSYDAGP